MSSLGPYDFSVYYKKYLTEKNWCCASPELSLASHLVPSSVTFLLLSLFPCFSAFLIHHNRRSQSLDRYLSFHVGTSSLTSLLLGSLSSFTAWTVVLGENTPSLISALVYLLSAKHIIPAVLFPSGSKLGSARIKPTVFYVTTVFPNHLLPALLPAGLPSRHAGPQTYCYSWTQEADKAREWQSTSNQVTGTPWMLPSHVWMVTVLSWTPLPLSLTT